MRYTLPSDNVDFFKSLIGQKITNVSRRLLESDLYLENYEQMADGPTELVFSNGKIVSFFPWTEIFSIGITQARIKREGISSIYKDLTNNSFWRQRVDRAITKVIILKSTNATEKDPMEFAIEFEFEDNIKVCIECVDDPDSLRIIKKHEETKCTKTVLSN